MVPCLDLSVSLFLSSPAWFRTWSPYSCPLLYGSVLGPDGLPVLVLSCMVPSLDLSVSLFLSSPAGFRTWTWLSSCLVLSCMVTYLDLTVSLFLSSPAWLRTWTWLSPCSCPLLHGYVPGPDCLPVLVLSCIILYLDLTVSLFLSSPASFCTWTWRSPCSCPLPECCHSLGWTAGARYLTCIGTRRDYVNVGKAFNIFDRYLFR